MQYAITILSLYRFSAERVWSVVTDRFDRPTLQTQALLALGAMSKRVRPSNDGLATQIVADLHHLLEQHTGEYLICFCVAGSRVLKTFIIV